MTIRETKDHFYQDNRRVEKIPVADIVPNPYQPRKSFSDEGLDELSRSIQRYGLLQPIVVRRTRSGKFELIAGERRLRATRRAGYQTINALVYAAGEQDSAVMALIENLQRENLHFFDEAEAYKNLLMEHGLTQEDLAKRIGRNQSTVANKLRILKMSKRVKNAICAGRLTERHARTLLRVPDEELQLELIAKIRADGLSVKLTEDLVERVLDQYYTDEQPKKRVLGIYRDGRLLINGIKKLVDQVGSSGLQATCQVDETGDGFQVVVFVPKNKVRPA